MVPGWENLWKLIQSSSRQHRNVISFSSSSAAINRLAVLSLSLPSCCNLIPNMPEFSPCESHHMLMLVTPGEQCMHPLSRRADGPLGRGSQGAESCEMTGMTLFGYWGSKHHGSQWPPRQTPRGCEPEPPPFVNCPRIRKSHLGKHYLIEENVSCICNRHFS